MTGIFPPAPSLRCGGRSTNPRPAGPLVGRPVSSLATRSLYRMAVVPPAKASISAR